MISVKNNVATFTGVDALLLKQLAAELHVTQQKALTRVLTNYIKQNDQFTQAKKIKRNK